MKEAIEEFYSYTNPYLNIDKRMEMKQKHTIRVMDLCRKIGESLNLTEEELSTAMMIGLLHDIGRFEQWKRYQTFSDASSIDHADLGVEILEKDNYISKYVKDINQYQIILEAIKYHNKLSIPKEVTGKDRMFSELIRDADKIDILYLYTTKGIVIDTQNDTLSDSIFQNLVDKEQINRLNIKKKADRAAVSLGFVFDLNFKESFKILEETKYMDKIIDIQEENNNNPEFHKQLKKIRPIINNYIKEKSIC